MVQVQQQQQQQQSEQDQEVRKGPWTEQEDLQLVCFVGLFGDRRWDSIAKVSGLNRTGKSCRLRWVNYLHPGLKRGKMTPLEERLVLEFHAKWGNRWSRIARKLPGRTDNEIKNYWRTHMRKKAQEKKRSHPSSSGKNSSSASASPSPSSSSSNITTVESLPFPDSTTGVEESFYDTGGLDDDKKPAVPAPAAPPAEYSMDDIWTELCYDNPFITEWGGVDDDAVHHQDQFYCSDSLWKMDDDEATNKLQQFNNNTNQFLSNSCLFI